MTILILTHFYVNNVWVTCHSRGVVDEQHVTATRHILCMSTLAQIWHYLCSRIAIRIPVGASRKRCHLLCMGIHVIRQIVAIAAPKRTLECYRLLLRNIRTVSKRLHSKLQVAAYSQGANRRSDVEGYKSSYCPSAGKSSLLVAS